MNPWDDFHGPNAAYLIEIYDRYCRDPESVSPEARAYFAHWTPPAQETLGDLGLPDDQLVGAVNLAQAIRGFGHLAASLDPLGSPPPGDPALDAATHGLAGEALARLPASIIGGPIAEGSANALDAINSLRKRYCSTVGFDYDHVHSPEERYWLRLAAESYSFRAPYDSIDLHGLLRQLTQVEVFEQFLQRVFPGKFRFSLEGLDMMVPMLSEMVAAAGPIDVEDIQRLVCAIDDAVDSLEAVSERMCIYQIVEVKKPARRLAHLIAEGAQELDVAIRGLRDKNLYDEIRRTHRTDQYPRKQRRPRIVRRPEQPGGAP